MKRIITLALMIVTSLTIIAQQRFYTTDGRTLKGYVYQTTDDLFIYSENKDFDGSFDTLQIVDVYSVLNENGSFEIITPTGLVPDRGSIVSQPKGMLQYDGEKLVSYNGKTISESEWLALASGAGVDETYRKGKTLRRVGTPLWAVGVGCIVAGGATMLAGWQNNTKAPVIIGESIAIFGAPLVLVGVPLHCVGAHLKKKSYETFNASEHTISATLPTINLQSSENGIGIALKF